MTPLFRIATLAFFLTLVSVAAPCEEKEVGVAVMHAAPAGSGKSAEERKANQAKAVLTLLKAAPEGAGLYVLPEAALTAWPDDEKTLFKNPKDARPFAYDLSKIHQALEAPFTEFAKAAEEKKAFVQVGLYEQEKGSEKIYNTVVVFGPDGKFVTKHRKINLLPDETKYLTPGDHHITTFNAERVALGEVGVAICADIYDRRLEPHLMEKYRRSNINFLSVSAEWQEEKDSEKGATHGWTPLKFFANTAEYLNRGEGLTNDARFPLLGAPKASRRTDHQIEVAVSNTTEPAKGAGIFLSDGSLAKNKLATETPWILSCVARKVKPPANAQPVKKNH